MSDRKKPRSLSEIVNDVLRAVRDYYDSEYVYYIEKEYGDIETIFEWCAENVPWQRDKIKMLPEEQYKNAKPISNFAAWTKTSSRLSRQWQSKVSIYMK